MLKKNTLQSLGLAFRHRIVQSTQAYSKLKPAQLPGSWIGEQAQNAWIGNDLPRHNGVRVKSIGVDPMSAVSNMGNPRRTDAIATIAGERAQFELKKSDYKNSRTRNQLAAQVFDLGLGTYGASALYRICADEGRIDVWTREQAAAVVKNVLKNGAAFEVPEAKESITFAPDISHHDSPEKKKNT